MPIVTISVDCESAISGKCYARELVQVAEEFTVPLTWLIFVSEKDPLSNINLYHTEYYHRIPAWHEMGLLLSFQNSQGYISDPIERGAAIRLGKDVLKQCHIKPTCFRAHNFDLLPDDIKNLEDIGILVDGSCCPGAKDKHGVTGPAGPGQPYHPSYSNLNEPGIAKIKMVPITTFEGVCACLDSGWEKVAPSIENSLKMNAVTHLSLTDDVDNHSTLRKALHLCKEQNATFVTLTQLAAYD